MRNLNELNDHRLEGPVMTKLFGGDGDHTCGAFLIKSAIDGGTLRVIAAQGDGWEHVSVSRENRCPNWPEMEQIKRAFFHDDETAMQLHVPVADHISVHPYTLHLWRPLLQDIPRPPAYMVG